MPYAMRHAPCDVRCAGREGERAQRRRRRRRRTHTGTRVSGQCRRRRRTHIARSLASAQQGGLLLRPTHCCGQRVRGPAPEPQPRAGDDDGWPPHDSVAPHAVPPLTATGSTVGAAVAPPLRPDSRPPTARCARQCRCPLSGRSWQPQASLPCPCICDDAPSTARAQAAHPQVNVSAQPHSTVWHSIAQCGRASRKAQHSVPHCPCAEHACSAG